MSDFEEFINYPGTAARQLFERLEYDLPEGSGEEANGEETAE